MLREVEFGGSGSGFGVEGSTWPTGGNGRDAGHRMPTAPPSSKTWCGPGVGVRVSGLWFRSGRGLEVSGFEFEDLFKVSSLGIYGFRVWGFTGFRRVSSLAIFSRLKVSGFGCGDLLWFRVGDLLGIHRDLLWFQA